MHGNITSEMKRERVDSRRRRERLRLSEEEGVLARGLSKPLPGKAAASPN